MVPNLSVGRYNSHVLYETIAIDIYVTKRENQLYYFEKKLFLPEKV